MATPDLPALPVTPVLPGIGEALEAGRKAVLVAPPGAGKTTLVPLHLLRLSFARAGKIVLLEPRRLAARAAARRMASLLGEQPGATVGYAMRMENRQSAATRILVVTEGVFANMVLDDPELNGVAAVLFDEFHQRSLDGDFGLALALDVQAGLREDLAVLVMSATIDGARVAEVMGGAPVIESHGRSFPVDFRYRERPANEPVEDSVARAIRDALATEQGSVLSFLPGRREIERTAERLQDRVPGDVDIVRLYGAMEGGLQDAAIRPPPPGRRKVVLATDIAETSITIDGVRIVVDSGLARQPKYEPATGLTRLETVRVSRASADQRAGRAGRTEPGIAIRLWRAEQTAALSPFAPPEILEADLAGLVLDCAAFGVADPARLAFLDPPPPPALAEARALLANLGALDKDGRITQTGAAMRALPLPVRLAHMCVEAARIGNARNAARLAVLITERGLGGNATDLERRLTGFADDRGKRAAAARQLADRIAGTAARSVADSSEMEGGASAGALLIQAWPDRVARARGGHGRFVLANGRGAIIDEADPLASEAWLVVADLQGAAQNARIMAAAAISEAEIRAMLVDRIETVAETRFDPASMTLKSRQVTRLGALVLAEKPLPAPAGDEAGPALCAAIRDAGLAILPWSKETMQLRARLDWLHRAKGEPWPAMDDETLTDTLEDWLLPFMAGATSLSRLAPILGDALMARIPHDLQRQVGRLAPTHFEAPTGSRVPIRYEAEGPVLAIRVQELYGLKDHPAIGGGTVPLALELLSPAHRPIQLTRDLPGFWRGSWADVRSEMRGRYPRHFWPEDPANAAPTSRAKPRGT